MIVSITFSIFLFIIFITLVNKKVSKVSYKNIYANSDNVLFGGNFNNKKIKIGGFTPSPILSYLYLNFAFFIIKMKIIYNKKLELIDKAMYESKNFIKHNYIKNMTIFDNVVYYNDFCRVIIISKDLLLKNNYKIDLSIITNYLNSNNFELTYNELIAFSDAIKYECINSLGKLSKYIIYQNRMKRLAKGKINKKHLSSTCYKYYFGLNNVELLQKELIKDNLYYDDIVSKYLLINNQKLNLIYNIVYSLNNISNINFKSFYFGYKLSETNNKLASYSNEKLDSIFTKVSSLNTSLKMNEKILLNKVVEYSDLLSEDLQILLDKKNKNLINFVNNNKDKEGIKKKL